MPHPRKPTNDGRTSKKRSAAAKPENNKIDGHGRPRRSTASPAKASQTAASPPASSRITPPILGAGDAAGHPNDLGEVPDRLILRPQVGRILNVHVSTVRRLEKSGALKPAVTDPSGTHFHSLHAVQEYAAAMQMPSAPTAEDNIDGELAAQAFTLLDGKTSSADLVKVLKIPPALARKLEQEWAELRGHVIIEGWTLAKIRARRSSTDTPLFSGEDILKYMDSIEFENCHGCRRPATFCTLCFLHQPKRAVEAARLEMHHAEMRQAAADHAYFERQMAEQARERQEYASAAPAQPYEQQPRRRPVSPPENRPRSDAAQPNPMRPPSGPPNTTTTGARDTADVSGRLTDPPAARANGEVANIVASGVVDSTRPAPHEKTSAGVPMAGARHAGKTRPDVQKPAPVSHFAGTASESWPRDVSPGPPPRSAVDRAPGPPDHAAAANGSNHRATTQLPPQTNGRRSSGDLDSVMVADAERVVTRSLDDRPPVTATDHEIRQAPEDNAK